MGILAILKRGRSAKSEQDNAAKNERRTRFRGVEIIPGEDGCCGAVAALGGKRMLSHEAPKLPLAECTAAECSCTYRLFDDRRSEVRRAADEVYDIASELFEDDQRSLSRTGRRESDEVRVRQ